MADTQTPAPTDASATEHSAGMKPLYHPQPTQAADSALKDHQIAALVNELRDIAVEFHGTQQLRERIARVVVPALKAKTADSVLEDAARLEFEMQHGSAIDAVRKQDDALILMLVERLERADKISGYANNKVAIKAGRARLEGVKNE